MDEENKKLKIVSITGCAAGIAHTFMAAEGIENGAKELGHQIKVETHGTAGPDNVLTAKEIREADLVLIAADINVKLDRFVGKKIYVTDTNLAIVDPTKLINEAIEKGWKHKVNLKSGADESEINALENKKESKVLKHIMYALGWMVPVVIASGLVMAIGNVRAMQPGWVLSPAYTWMGVVFPGISDPGLVENGIYVISGTVPDSIFGSTWWSISNLGDFTIYYDGTSWVSGLPEGSSWGKIWSFDGRPVANTLFSAGAAGMKLIYPIIAAALAYSIAGKITFAPAFLGGWLMNDGDFLNVYVDGSPVGMGFLGALVIGFFVGYMAILFKKIKWHKQIKGIADLMILPFVMLLITTLMSRYVFGFILSPIVIGMFNFIEYVDGIPGGALLLAALVAGMIAFDLGGPVNKTALVAGTAIFLSSVSASSNPADWNFVPGTATQAAISVPPLAAFFSVMIFGKYFTNDERTLGTNASFMGLVGITEGAIPFTLKRPKIFVPANVIGAMVSGMLVTALGFQFYGGLGSPLGAFLGYVPSTVIDNYILSAFTWGLLVCFGALVSTGIIYIGVKITFKTQQKNRLISEAKVEHKKVMAEYKKEMKKLKLQQKNNEGEFSNEINELLEKMSLEKARFKELKEKIKEESKDNFKVKTSEYHTSLSEVKETHKLTYSKLQDEMSVYKANNYEIDKKSYNELKEQFKQLLTEEYEKISTNGELDWKEKYKSKKEAKKKNKENFNTEILNIKYYAMKNELENEKKFYSDELHKVNDVYLRGVQ